MVSNNRDPADRAYVIGNCVDAKDAENGELVSLTAVRGEKYADAACLECRRRERAANVSYTGNIRQRACNIVAQQGGPRTFLQFAVLLLLAYFVMRDIKVFLIDKGMLRSQSGSELYSIFTKVTPVLPSAMTPQNTSAAIFLGIISGPTNAERRNTWRRECATALREAGIEYKFFIGRPSRDTRSLDDYVYDRLATKEEQAVARQLVAEAEKEKDITFLPLRDHYIDLTDKTINFLQRGYASGAELIVKADDDMCVLPTPLRKLVASRRYASADRMLYGCFAKNISPKKGSPIGEIAPYCNGPTYVLSRPLVSAILRPENNAFIHLHAIYGSSSEDVNVGTWVQLVRKQNPLFTIDYEVIPVARKTSSNTHR